MNKPKVILFAGAAGSGKTPIATYLSWSLGLPIFNNDAIRREVLEDTKNPVLDDQLQLARRNERLEALVQSKRSFILDASIDRTWDEVTKKLDENGYESFLISLDLSQKLLGQTAAAKKYSGTAPKEVVDKWFNDHALFVTNHRDKIDLSIEDNDYLNRLEICREKVAAFLKS